MIDMESENHKKMGDIPPPAPIAPVAPNFKDFLNLSPDELMNSRKSVKSKYKNLSSSTPLESVICHTLQQLQILKVKIC